MTPQEYKNKTIAACRKLVEKYRNPAGKKFFSHNSCPLCKIYGATIFTDCYGCFQNSKNYYFDGCFMMVTLRLAISQNVKLIKKLGVAGFDIRARFHELAIPILEKIDAQYFTPEGWEYEAFEAIRELDRKLAEGVIK